MQKHYTGKQKAQIVLEILKEEKTVTHISSEYGVHSSQLYKWRAQALEGLHTCLTTRKQKKLNKVTRNEN